MISEKEVTECAQCNRSFVLSEITPSLTNLISALSVSSHDNGLCLSCHIDRLKELIDNYLQVLTEDKIQSIQQLGRPNYLIKGIDYNINESGNWIFTKWYLLRKGPCCGRGCQNCPY